MNSTLDEILALASDILKVNIDTIKPSSGIENTPEWDSVNHMSLILAIESHFSIELTGDEIGELTSIDRICDCISSKLRIKS